MWGKHRVVYDSFRRNSWLQRFDPAAEPEPTNAAILRENLQVRALSCAVEVAEVALGDKAGVAMLALAGKQKGDHRIVKGAGARHGVTIEVPIVALDEIAAAWPRVDFLKMDIQGSELRALRGMRSVLNRSPDPILLVEFWPYGLRFCGSDPRSLLEELRGLGFALWEVTDEGPLLRPIGPHVDADFVARVGFEEVVKAPNLICARHDERLRALTG